MSTMSAQITAFVDTTNIFDVVQKKDRKKISQTVTVHHLKGICNVIISLTSVPKCLADSVGTMKIAHRKFIQDSPKGEKGPLQAMLSVFEHLLGTLNPIFAVFVEKIQRMGSS